MLEGLLALKILRGGFRSRGILRGSCTGGKNACRQSG